MWSASRVVGLLVVIGPHVATAGSPARCVVPGRDVTIEELTVNGFAVDISHVRATATLMGDRTGVTVDVEGDISFRATAPRLWFTVSTATVANGGLVRLFPGAHVIADRLAGSAVSGAAGLYAMDVMQGEDKPADESASSVLVPCKHLTLDWSQAPGPVPAVTGTVWRSKATSLTLHAAPVASAASVTYAATGCDERCLIVRGDLASNGYRRVETVNEQVQLRGWVHASELVEVSDDEGSGYSYGCTGAHRGSFDRSYDRSWSSLQRARLAAGTPIFDAPDGTAWAHVTRDLEFDVRGLPGARWAEVVSIAGVTHHGHAYVPVTSLLSGAGGARSTSPSRAPARN